MIFNREVYKLSERFSDNKRSTHDCVSVAWPCLMYRVSVAERPRQSGNIFENTILRLIRWGITDTKELHDYTKIPHDFVRLICQSLIEQKYITGHHDLTEDGQRKIQSLENIAAAYDTVIPNAVLVFVDALSGQLIPGFVQSDVVPLLVTNKALGTNKEHFLEIDVGTIDNPRSEKIQKIVPSRTDTTIPPKHQIIDSLKKYHPNNRQKKQGGTQQQHIRFYEDSQGQPIAKQVYLYTVLSKNKSLGDRGYFIADPFELSQQSPSLTYSFQHWANNAPALQGRLDQKITKYNTTQGHSEKFLVLDGFLDMREKDTLQSEYPELRRCYLADQKDRDFFQATEKSGVGDQQKGAVLGAVAHIYDSIENVLERFLQKLQSTKIAQDLAYWEGYVSLPTTDWRDKIPPDLQKFGKFERRDLLKIYKAFYVDSTDQHENTLPELLGLLITLFYAGDNLDPQDPILQQAKAQFAAFCKGINQPHSPQKYWAKRFADLHSMRNHQKHSNKAIAAKNYADIWKVYQEDALPIAVSLLRNIVFGVHKAQNNAPSNAALGDSVLSNPVLSNANITPSSSMVLASSSIVATWKPESADEAQQNEELRHQISVLVKENLGYYVYEKIRKENPQLIEKWCTIETEVAYYGQASTEATLIPSMAVLVAMSAILENALCYFYNKSEYLEEPSAIAKTIYKQQAQLPEIIQKRCQELRIQYSLSVAGKNSHKKIPKIFTEQEIDRFLTQHTETRKLSAALRGEQSSLIHCAIALLINSKSLEESCKKASKNQTEIWILALKLHHYRRHGNKEKNLPFAEVLDLYQGLQDFCKIVYG